MNKGFACGVLYTIGLAVFGKSMYELGVKKAEKNNAEKMEKCVERLEDLLNGKEKEEES